MHTYIHTYVNAYILTYVVYTYMRTYIHTYLSTYLHAYIPGDAKMAGDVNGRIEDALNLIVSTAERCGNMKKEFKPTVY